MMGSWLHACGRVLAGLGVCAKYLLLYVLLAPRRTARFVRALGHHLLAYDRLDSGAMIPQRRLADLFPGIEDVQVVLHDVSWRDGNVSTAELYCLCAIARVRRIRSGLEIGTFDGLVMSQLVRNVPAEARLVTVDLRPEDLPGLQRPLAHGEAAYVQKAAIGEKLARLPEAERARITQLYGDSTQLDFSRYYGQMDLVFIDASHQYEYVKHDSEEAFRLRSPRGIIIWQDYLSWPDVTRYLNELRHRHSLIRIEGTTLVVLRPDAEGS